ncbi:MAG: hypothetical protein R3B89_18935 [Polyangiaceae bacterium]
MAPERLTGSLLGLALLSGVGCSPAEVIGHRAPVSNVPAYSQPAPVRHASRLWVELRDETPNTQCIQALHRQPVCFREVRDRMGEQLVRLLSPSFPDVRVRQRGDALEPGDYLLRVQLQLNAVEPGAEVGWGTVARGRWQLVRDGFSLTRERFSSHSEPRLTYGSALGVGAGEVVAAVATRIAERLGSLPETRGQFPAPDLPEVVVEAPRSLPRGAGQARQSSR